MVPPPQVVTHCPFEQTCPSPQAVPHWPQLLRSVWVSRQTPLQIVVPAAHESWQVPRSQISPLAQARPHMPQWARSV